MAVPLDFLPRDLRKALLKFQKDGIRFGIEKEGRCLIGDEMGLGKTLQALSIAFYYKQQWPLLIVVPASLRLPWVDEIEKWFPEIQPEDINLVKNCADIGALSKAKISILSYGMMSYGNNTFGSALTRALETVDFGVAILDESHMIKNRQATRTKRVMKLLKNIRRVILLTGTPTLARPEELYCQINIIRPGLVGGWESFGRTYCDGRYILQPVERGRTCHKFDTRGASNLQELHDILKTNIMIRRLKKDVLTQLPAKRRQKIRFEISTDSKNKKELDESMERFKHKVKNLKSQFSQPSLERLTTMNDVRGAILRLFTATGLAKAGAIQQYIESLLDGMENKFIVFCFHLAVIDAVTEVLAKRHVKHVRLAGDVPADIRANHVREFQTDPNCRVAVLSISASCMGFTLTAADHVVFAELHWTPGIMQQAEDRCHRIGQQNAVQIHYLIAKGTFDVVLWNMLSRKLTVTGEALDGKAKLLNVDEADREQADLLSLCKAWIPDDDDDDDDCDAYLFTQKPKGADKNQRDIRSSFAMSGKKEPTRKRRRTNKYYEEGIVNISDSDDNGEFKTEFKSKRRKKMRNDVKELTNQSTIDALISTAGKNAGNKKSGEGLKKLAGDELNNIQSVDLTSDVICKEESTSESGSSVGKHQDSDGSSTVPSSKQSIVSETIEKRDIRCSFGEKACAKRSKVMSSIDPKDKFTFLPSKALEKEKASRGLAFVDSSIKQSAIDQSNETDVRHCYENKVTVSKSDDVISSIDSNCKLPTRSSNALGKPHASRVLPFADSNGKRNAIERKTDRDIRNEKKENPSKLDDSSRYFPIDKQIPVSSKTVEKPHATVISGLFSSSRQKSKAIAMDVKNKPKSSNLSGINCFIDEDKSLETITSSILQVDSGRDGLICSSDREEKLDRERNFISERTTVDKQNEQSEISFNKKRSRRSKLTEFLCKINGTNNLSTASCPTATKTKSTKSDLMNNSGGVESEGNKINEVNLNPFNFVRGRKAAELRSLISGKDKSSKDDLMSTSVGGNSAVSEVNCMESSICKVGKVSKPLTLTSKDDNVNDSCIMKQNTDSSACDRMITSGMEGNSFRCQDGSNTMHRRKEKPSKAGSILPSHTFVENTQQAISSVDKPKAETCNSGNLDSLQNNAERNEICNQKWNESRLFNNTVVDLGLTSEVERTLKCLDDRHSFETNTADDHRSNHEEDMIPEPASLEALMSPKSASQQSNCNLDISSHSINNTSFSSDVTETDTADMSGSFDDISLIEDSNSWNCSTCTFLNHSELEICEICETKRPNMFTRLKERSRSRKKESNCGCGERGGKVEGKGTTLNMKRRKQKRKSELKSLECKSDTENIVDCESNTDDIEARNSSDIDSHGSDVSSRNSSNMNIANMPIYKIALGLEKAKCDGYSLSVNTSREIDCKWKSKTSRRPEVISKPKSTVDRKDIKHNGDQVLVNEAVRIENVEISDIEQQELDSGSSSRSLHPHAEIESSPLIVIDESDSTICDDDGDDCTMIESPVMKKSSNANISEASCLDSARTTDQQGMDKLELEQISENVESENKDREEDMMKKLAEAFVVDSVKPSDENKLEQGLNQSENTLSRSDASDNLTGAPQSEAYDSDGSVELFDIHCDSGSEEYKDATEEYKDSTEEDKDSTEEYEFSFEEYKDATEECKVTTEDDSEMPSIASEVVPRSFGFKSASQLLAESETDKTNIGLHFEAKSKNVFSSSSLRKSPNKENSLIHLSEPSHYRSSVSNNLTQSPGLCPQARKDANSSDTSKTPNCNNNESFFTVTECNEYLQDTLLGKNTTRDKSTKHNNQLSFFDDAESFEIDDLSSCSDITEFDEILSGGNVSENASPGHRKFDEIENIEDDDIAKDFISGDCADAVKKASKSANHHESASVEESGSCSNLMNCTEIPPGDETDQVYSSGQSKCNLEDLFPDDEEMLCEDFDDDISVISSEKSEYESQEEEEPEEIELRYKLSFESDRLYLYDQDENALHVNLQIPEVGSFCLEESPSIFKHPSNLKQLKKFTREWHALTLTKQRMVRKAGKIFKSPLQVYEELKDLRYKPSKERYTSKEKRNEKVLTIANMIGGKVTELAKPESKKSKDSKTTKQTASNGESSATGTRNSKEAPSSTNLLQAVNSDGNALCLFCNEPVDSSLKPGTISARFCSSTCKEEYEFRCEENRGIVRSRLFELQKGVCQLCNFDTRDLFMRIKALKKKERRTALEATKYKSLSPSILNKMILMPKLGLFWEADHIDAVSEGGGECGLENYRTLCINCHKEVTKDLMERLRKQRKLDKAKSEGNSDIVGFFNKETRVKSKEKTAPKTKTPKDSKTNQVTELRNIACSTITNLKKKADVGDLEPKKVGRHSKQQQAGLGKSSANIDVHDVKAADVYISSLISKSAQNKDKKNLKPKR